MRARGRLVLDEAVVTQRALLGDAHVRYVGLFALALAACEKKPAPIESVESLVANPQRLKELREACKAGFLNATELADYLVGKGLPFREAHHVTGQCVAAAESQGKGLEDLTLAEMQALEPRIEQDVYAILDYAAAVRRRETPGGTGPQSIAAQVAQLRSWLAGMSGTTI